MQPASDLTALERPWDRTSKVLLVLLGLVMLGCLPWLVHPWYEVNDETNDASMYILSAKALLRGEGYAYLERPFIVRPPALSVLLTPILAWRGLDFWLMHLMVSLWGVAGVLLLFVWTRERLGPWVAAAVALCLWQNPGYQHFSNQVMTDVPGSTCILAAFVLERWAARRPSWRRDALLGAVVGLSTYMRSVTMLLLPAILAARLVERLRAGPVRPTWSAFLRGRVVALTLAMLLVMLPWSVRNALVAPPPPADQNYVYSYSAGLFHEDAGDPNSPLRSPAELAAIVPKRAAEVADLLGGRLEGRGSESVLAKVLGLWVTASVLVLLLRSWRSSEFLFLLVGAVLLIYFGFRVRLGLPMYVVGLCAWTEVHCALTARFLGEKRARAVTGAALLALTALDFQPHKDWDVRREKLARVQEQARAFSERLPADARCAARIGWHHSLFLDRPVWSLRFAIERAERAQKGDLVSGWKSEAIESVLDDYGLNTILVGLSNMERFDLLPILNAVQAPGEPVGEGWIFRVR